MRPFYLFLINPLFLFLSITAFVFLLRSYGGMDYPQLSYRSITMIVLSVVGFSVSYFFSKVIPCGKNGYILDAVVVNSKVSRMLSFVLAVSLFWFIFATLELFSNLDSLSRGITTARFESIGRGVEGSFLGGLKNLTLGFPVVGMLIIIMYPERVSRHLRMVGVVLFILSILYGFLAGGRNPAFTSILLCSFAFFMKRSYAATSHVKMRLVYKFFLIILIFTVFYHFVMIFFERAELRGRGAAEDIENIVSGFALGGWVVEVEEPSEILQIYTMLVFYATHAINEMNVVINNGFGPYGGSYSLYLPFIFLNKLGFELMSINDVVADLDKQGVYLGLLGSLYLDFGAYSLGFYAFFGFMAGLLERKVRKSLSPVASLFFVWILGLITLSYFYPIFSVGNGFSILIAIFAVGIYGKFRVGRG